jgi:hypothetical protein
MLRRYKGPDRELLERYRAALDEVQQHLEAERETIPLITARAA